MSSGETVCVGDVWRDLQEASSGRLREVMVTALSESGDFAFVVATPSRRHTRIHRETLRRRFMLISRLPYRSDS